MLYNALMQNKIITQITYKLKRQTKESYTFVYLVIFYEVDKNCCYSEVLICAFVEESNVLLFWIQKLVAHKPWKNYLRLPYRVYKNSSLKWFYT